MYKIHSSISGNNASYFDRVGEDVLISKELDWIAQQLSQWLGIPITYPEPPQTTNSPQAK